MKINKYCADSCLFHWANPSHAMHRAVISAVLNFVAERFRPCPSFEEQRGLGGIGGLLISLG